MKIAIASGKGGTGKTTLAVNLALVVPEAVALLDCDVEEPNCHIFLAPTVDRSEAIGVMVPVVDPDRCLACGSCSHFCQYHAIAGLDTGPLIFPELCHSCGGCVRVCPTGAMSETTREIGLVEEGWAGPVRVIQGRLRITEASSPPLIRAVKKRAPADGMTLIDCPPGTSCPVIAALRGVDFAILVTEPTPFGLHDLRLAVGTVRTLNIAFGVVVNRAQAGNRSIHEYCEAERIPILLEVPDSRQVAEAYSKGLSVLDALPGLRGDLDRLYREIKIRVGPETGSEPRECPAPRQKRSPDQPAGRDSQSQS
ncbi:MAG: (4Fe-4S)-binding protein [Acidobacteria bacterium]|nr:MAG: (4Fe-4S)-binding protein [Acidobacteriota bacterium]